MDGSHNNLLPVIYADIENLQRELEQMCSSLKTGPAESDKGDSTPAHNDVPREE